jgi:hypothetical protein
MKSKTSVAQPGSSSPRATVPEAIFEFFQLSPDILSIGAGSHLRRKRLLCRVSFCLKIC